MIDASSLSLGQALVWFFLKPVLSLLWLLLLIGIVMSWLISFNVVNTSNQFVSLVWRITSAVTEPLLRPIRSVVPPIGGMDFSALVLLLIIYFAQGYIIPVLMRVL
jgi:YggT family protein